MRGEEGKKNERRRLFFFVGSSLSFFYRFDQTYIYEEILSEVPTIATIHTVYI